MTARRHHPSCAAADGGNCTNCPQWPPIPGKPVHQSDITCECGETYVIAGETSEARERALAAWPGCPCAPKTASEATAFEADAPGVPAAEWTIGRRVVRSTTDTGFLHRLRAWWATWPFAADEFTA